MSKAMALRTGAIVAAVFSVCDAVAAQDVPARRPPRSQATTIYRFINPAQGRAVCRPNERQCATGQYIVWCCRADQACDYGYVGGCR